MKCLQCKWDDKNAPKSGKCCGECGLCALCEQFTLYCKVKYNLRCCGIDFENPEKLGEHLHLKIKHIRDENLIKG